MAPRCEVACCAPRKRIPLCGLAPDHSPPPHVARVDGTRLKECFDETSPHHPRFLQPRPRPEAASNGGVEHARVAEGRDGTDATFTVRGTACGVRYMPPTTPPLAERQRALEASQSQGADGGLPTARRGPGGARTRALAPRRASAANDDDRLFDEYSVYDPRHRSHLRHGTSANASPVKPQRRPLLQPEWRSR